VLDSAAVAGEHVVEMFTGEDRPLGVTLSGDLTGATFAFALATSLAEALAGTGVATVADADIDVSGSTVTVGADDIGTADLDAGGYFYALRRTDDGNRSVVAWGPWTVVGA
jgi:hypothetical protein